MRLTANCDCTFYTSFQRGTSFLTRPMSTKNPPHEPRFEALKDESARQRWQLFHRAIAHAKQSNYQALEEPDKAGRQDNEGSDGEPGSTRPDPRLSIGR